MSEQPNSNLQIAQSVTGFLDKHSSILWQGIKSLYRRASEETRLNWRLGYEHYLERALNKYFYAKTFLSTTEPVALDRIYEPLSVRCGEYLIEKASIEDLARANKFAAICATGGSGKTMLMRHLFVETIRRTHRVPVFVELRELNQTELTLFELIRKKLRDNRFDFSDDYIEMAFRAGHFALFLDGFDEIAYGKRKQTVKEIEEIADRYESNFIVLSSRPDDALFQWTLFNVWTIDPLGLNSACALVQKTETDPEIKEKFTRALRTSLFEKHHSFLSNPLLLSIMLITYKDSAHIPQKLSTFYERAYTALFEQHDAKKGAYYRDKRAKLDILEFRKAFAAFSFLTYHRRKLHFSEIGFYEFLDKAQTLSGLHFNKKDFLEDAVQAVCLLIRDGLDVTFAHRSFQEYFTALYISQLGSEDKQRRSLARLVSLAEKQIPVFLLYEIAPEIVEKHLIIPFLEKLAREIDYRGNLTSAHYRRFVRTLLAGLGFNYLQQKLFAVREETRSGFENQTNDFDLRSIYDNYWPIFANYIRDLPQTLPGGDFEARFGSVYEKQFLEHHDESLTDVSVRIEKLTENKTLFHDFAAREHIYSRRTLEDLLAAGEKLRRKHRAQDVFFDEELAA